MPRTGYIPTLDGWRAVAILLVLTLHALSPLGTSEYRMLRLVAQAAGGAGVGVDVFFALSGYLIGTLLLREKAVGTRHILARFYVRRACRILPPLLIYLAVIVSLSCAEILPGVSRSEVLASLGFVRNYARGSWYTVHLWSLAVEEHFYLLAPLILIFLQRQAAVIVTVAVALIASTWRMIEHRTGWMTVYLPGTYWPHRTENRLDGLMNGVILAIALDHPRVRGWLVDWLTTGRTALLAAATLGVLVFSPDPAASRTLFATIFPLILAHTILRPAGMAGVALELAPMRALGLVSYSLYLWQQLFLPPPSEAAPGAIARLQQSTWSLPLALLCATASFHAIERPMVALGWRLACGRVFRPRTGRQSVTR